MSTEREQLSTQVSDSLSILETVQSSSSIRELSSGRSWKLTDTLGGLFSLSATNGSLNSAFKTSCGSVGSMTESSETVSSGSTKNVTTVTFFDLLFFVYSSIFLLLFWHPIISKQNKNDFSKIKISLKLFTDFSMPHKNYRNRSNSCVYLPFFVKY